MTDTQTQSGRAAPVDGWLPLVARILAEMATFSPFAMPRAAQQVMAWMLLATAATEASPSATSMQVYSGMCDASAAIAVDDRTFLIADDEQSALWVYPVDHSGPPLQRIPFNLPQGAKQNGDGQTEFDIEGVARIKDRIYWISSHGRNKNGVLRLERHQFVALRATKSEDGIVTSVVGNSFCGLANGLAADPRLQVLGVEAALKGNKKKVEELAPKAEGLNIEGLCETREGDALLIGLRNPRPRDRSLIVPLRNPDDVIMNRAKPEFGSPILLNLSVKFRGKTIPLGIRSLAFARRKDRYLIVAGPHDSGPPFAVFEWTGEPGDPPQLMRAATIAIAQVRDFTPEALIVHEDHNRIQLFSDDGSLDVPVISPSECEKGAFKKGYCEAKDLVDPQRKTFRSIFVSLE